MSKSEFEGYYCKEAQMTIEEYKECFVTLPCNCGDDVCKGWACVSNSERSIKAHKELYM